MNKKYEILKDDYVCLSEGKAYRIKALKSFNDVKAGDLGGYIQNESNLSHDGDCWLYDNAKVFENARVLDNARIKDEALVYGNSTVYNDAFVSGESEVYDNSKVFEKARIWENAEIFGNAMIFGSAEIKDFAVINAFAKVYGNAVVSDYSSVSGDAIVYDNAGIFDRAFVVDHTTVSENAVIKNDVIIADYVNICGDVQLIGDLYFSGNTTISSMHDYIVFKNNWSSGRYFMYIKPTKLWIVGCFTGTSDELVEKAYKDGENIGKHYEAYVKLVEQLEEFDSEFGGK